MPTHSQHEGLAHTLLSDRPCAELSKDELPAFRGRRPETEVPHLT